MTITDPDGDTVKVIWLLDGVAVGQGTSYGVFPNLPAQRGVHRVQVVADDGKPGGVIAHSWTVVALDYDSDGDGWHANVDCNDSSALIHPAMTEAVGNGIDDDCNPRTTDTGLVLASDRFVVTKLVDTADGVCDTDCSLREAVLAANQSSEQSITIELGAGVHGLSIQGAGEQESATGDLDLAPVANQTITITGQSAATTVIDATGLQDRALDVRTGAVIVEKLTIRGVDTTSRSGDTVGAIYVNPGDVGPIWESDYVAPTIPPKPTELTVRDAVLTGNKTSFGGGAIGTARGTAKITIVRSQIVNNMTDGYGGAIFSNGYGQIITLEDSLVQGNSACYAGAIVKEACPGRPGDLIVLRNTQVVSNVAGLSTGACNSTLIANGGAIVSDHLLAISSTIDYNTADNWGGGIATRGCGYDPKIRLVNSSVSHNRLTGDNDQNQYYGVHGAGIYAYLVAIEAENSVIAFNQAPAPAGGIVTDWSQFTNTVVSHNAGDGIFVTSVGVNPPPSIVNSTIHNNQGNGIMVRGGALLMANTILANNQSGNCGDRSATWGSLGYNLSDDDTCLLLTATGDMTNTNPLLATILVNGVEETTYRLQPTSPAIDRASTMLCPRDDVDEIQRPQAGDCDIGASEYVPASLLRFTQTQVRVAAGSLAVALAVERVGDTIGEVTVHYTTDDATAKSGEDYVASTGMLTFATGETVKTIPLTLLNSTRKEEPRSFVVALSSPTGGAQLVGVNQAAITIEYRGDTLYLPLIKR